MEFELTQIMLSIDHLKFIKKRYLLQNNMYIVLLCLSFSNFVNNSENDIKKTKQKDNSSLLHNITDTHKSI